MRRKQICHLRFRKGFGLQSLDFYQIRGPCELDQEQLDIYQRDEESPVLFLQDVILIHQCDRGTVGVL